MADRQNPVTRRSADSETAQEIRKLWKVNDGAREFSVWWPAGSVIANATNINGAFMAQFTMKKIQGTSFHPVTAEPLPLFVLL